MTKRRWMTAGAALALAMAWTFAAEPAAGPSLPKPRTSGGKPLLDTLAARQTVRAFAPDKLPDQLLSDLLWAACGVNRPDSGKRTAPTAMNSQEIDVYVAREDGLFLFDAKTHALSPVLPADLRAATGKQAFAGTAPINLVYVADLTRMKGPAGMPESEKLQYAACDTGFVAENVYLFCASEGLATVVRGAVDREALAAAMKLRPEQKIILAQTVGYPKK